jgi:hypothetical protein
LTTVIFAWSGFYESMTAAGEHPSFGDLLYRVILIFVLREGTVDPPVPWQLDLARFLAPALAASATLAAVATLLRERLVTARARRFSGHAVVCGLGATGAQIAVILRDRGYRVVAIERDAANPRISVCKDAGAIVLVGDGSDMDLLRRAGGEKAAYLFAVTADDMTNSEIALAGRVLTARRRRDALTCFVHIHDQTLSGAVRRFAIAECNDGKFRLESFSIAERASSALLDAHPPFDESGKTASGRPRILVVGASDTARELIVEAARRWRKHRGGKSHRLRVTVIDEDAEVRIAALKERYPQLNTVCEITTRSIGLESAEFTRAEFLREGTRIGVHGETVTIVYVCVDDEARGISAAIHLRRRLGREQIPMVVCLETDRDGFAGLLRPAGDGSAMYGQIDVFGLLDCLSDAESLLRGNNELVAMAMNADYCDYIAAEKGTRETRGAAALWGSLTPADRESNRQAAAHVGRKLEAIGCDLEPLVDWDEHPFLLTSVEVETLARMEHDRWWQWHTSLGWRQAPVRDRSRKEHPDMVPYDELSPETQEKDRVQVRRIPKILHELDFRIVRGRPAGTGENPGAA